MTEITLGPPVVTVLISVPALIRSFFLACVICFIAAFWITLSWWHWLVALLALTASLTIALPRIVPMLASFVGMLQGKKPLKVGAEITVVWNDERHTIVLSPADWQGVKAGLSVTRRGGGYVYRGKWFGDIWHFNGPVHELVVDYKYSGGEMGTGYNGSLRGVHISRGTVL